MTLGIVEFNQKYQATTPGLAPIDKWQGRTVHPREDLVTKKQSIVVAFEQVARKIPDPENERVAYGASQYELQADKTVLFLGDGSTLTVPVSYEKVGQLLAESRKTGAAVNFTVAELPSLRCAG
jgi:hypothetical protein